MNDKNCAASQGRNIREAVCIHTDKVYDSCRDKECLENLRVYIPTCSQSLIDTAINIKVRKAEVIWVYQDVEPVPFNDGYYSVDIKFFFRITLDVFSGVGRPTTVYGLATFDKKVVLFGSEGKAKVYSSSFRNDAVDTQFVSRTNLPKAVVEVVDPIALGAKIVEGRPPHCCCDDLLDASSLPSFICNCFDGEFIDLDPTKKVFVTLGLFSIIKIERQVQLLVPVYDFCIPDKECVAATPDNPCELFDSINFPLDEFYPPREENDNSCGCCK